MARPWKPFRAHLKRETLEKALLRRNLTKTAFARLAGLHRIGEFPLTKVCWVEYSQFNLRANSDAQQ